MRTCRQVALVFVVALLAETAWAAPIRVCDAVVHETPAGWKVENTSKCRTTLKKIFERNGYWYEEWISLQAAKDDYNNLQNTLEDLHRLYHFELVDHERLSFGETAAPFWIMYRTNGEGESVWLALLLHMGLTYSVEMRASALDLDAVTEYAALLSAMAFAPDERELAWQALIAGNAAQAQQKFSSLLNSDGADVNARYGYGLARLAQGDARGAEEAIERARPQLGVLEDARRALGSAALVRGDVNRAVALWISVLRDHPSWEGELRPLILAAIQRNQSREVEPRQSNLESLNTDGSQVLLILEAVDRDSMLGEEPEPVDEDTFNALSRDASLKFSRALEEVQRNPKKPVNLRALLAALDVEQGIGLAGAGIAKGDFDKIRHAELLIVSGLKRMGDARAPR